jgi:hypothetical protein
MAVEGSRSNPSRPSPNPSSESALQACTSVRSCLRATDGEGERGSRRQKLGPTLDDGAPGGGQIALRRPVT